MKNVKLSIRPTSVALESYLYADRMSGDRRIPRKEAVFFTRLRFTLSVR